MNISPLVEYMRQFVDLNSQDIDVLSKYVNQRKYLKGQYIVQQGDVCKYESFVIKGCIKTFHIDHKGEEHISMFAIENWWTADLGSFLNQSPAYYNVQCLENTEVIQFPFENLETLYFQVPKLERLFRILIQRAYIASEERIIKNFSLPAKERYLKFREKYPEIEQRVPQYMIASYLGITKEFLSKIRSQLILDQ